MSKNTIETSWERIFSEDQILEKLTNNEYFRVKSSRINEVKEARLMAKFDHESKLPNIFKQNKLSILPISRSEYIIGHFKTYFKIPEEKPTIKRIQQRRSLQSLKFKDITSESTSLNCVFAFGLLQDFTSDQNLVPTVSGRMSSSSFNFQIESSNRSQPIRIEVENSQIEIDGGYEGDNSLTIIEAKSYEPDDLLIRQLYYPFRLWRDKVAKEVKLIYLTHTNGIFHLREFEFLEKENYNSIRLAKQKRYVIEEEGEKFNLEDLEEIMNTVKFEEEPSLPFPQADSFERIITLCEIIDRDKSTLKQDIDLGSITNRQYHYYISAAKYLDLIQEKEDEITLSKKGKEVMSSSRVERQKKLARQILCHKVFYETIKKTLDEGNIPNKEEVVDIMKKNRIYRVDSEETYSRRSSTIASWVKWIFNQLEE